MSAHAAPTRTLPPKPSLAQLRKQAKELLRSYRVGQQAAVAEIQRFERSPDPVSFGLADAQRVLARAYGFSSWPALKHHVEGVHFGALLAAAETGDVAAVRRLAAARPELVNPRLAELRDSGLHRAVLRRDPELTRVLMQLGADARAGIWPHRDATSPHAIAVDRQFSEIVTIIEREEANRRANASPATAIAALWQAITDDGTADAIALLEANPPLIGACDVDGVTPLHLAAWKHDPALVAWLLDRGASPNALASCAEPVQRDKAESGKTPLDFAAIVAGWPAEPSDRAYYFMENARLDPVRFQETARLLREKEAELTPRAAVALGDAQAVLALLRAGRLPNEIHLFRGGLLAIAVRVNRPDLVALLLDLGFDADEAIVTDDGAVSSGMPLWFASMCGRHEIAKSLLARGADVNAIVYACGDSLCMAADERMQTLLRQHGARLTVERVTDPHTAQAILDGTLPASSLNVSNPTRTNLAEQMLWASGNTEVVRLCLPHIARPRDDPWWNYVLIHAGQPDKLQLILGHGVDPDVVGEGGFTMLHHVATNYAGQAHRLTRATLLLDAGASLEKRDPLLKSTPLGWACRWGQMDLAQLYLQRGADVVERDAEPWATPLAWATKGGHQEIAQLLRALGQDH